MIRQESASVRLPYRSADRTKSDEGRSLLLRQIVTEALASVGLTPTEEDIARLMLKGMAADDIAVLSKRSPKTVKQHISTIYEKFGVNSRGMFFHCVFPT